MTRVEKLAQQERHAVADLADARQRVKAVRERRQQAERRERDRHVLRLGTLVAQTGLGTLPESDLVGLLTQVARLTTIPHPVPVLETLIDDMMRTDGAALGGTGARCAVLAGALAGPGPRPDGDGCEVPCGTALPPGGGVAAPRPGGLAR